MKTLKSNDVFRHSLIIIRGNIECPNPASNYPNSISGRFIQVNNKNINQYSNKIDSKWPVSSLNEFRLIAQLSPGSNNIELIYLYRKESAKLNIRFNYDNSQDSLIEPNHLVIYLTKDSREKFAVADEFTERNDLSSAIKRFRLIARMWQAFTSENLNNFKLGLKSFRLEEDSNGEVVVNIVRSKTLTLSNFLKSTGNEIYDNISDSIRTDETFMKKKKSGIPIHVTCLVIDSQWNGTHVLGPTALGGGDGFVQLGEFGKYFIIYYKNIFHELFI